MNQGHYISMGSYKERCAARSNAVLDFIQKAIELPSGYHFTSDSQSMYGNALLRIRPDRQREGDKSVHFFHSLHYRGKWEGGEYLVMPTEENIWASCDVLGSSCWDSDRAFGEDGRLSVRVIGNDLTSALADLAATVSSMHPFVKFEWRHNDHDHYKLELFNGEDRLQSIWKSGRTWATLMGTSSDTQSAAKVLAEEAARQLIRSRHAERLTGLSTSPHFRMRA